MDAESLKELVCGIVRRARELKDRHTAERDARVNYACVFAQSDEEFEELSAAASELGSVVKETPTGPLFQVNPVETVSGQLQLVKIRKPDPTRPERGDADFTVASYDEFKKKVFQQQGFKLIERETMEMIELMDPAFDVRAYFSHPPLHEQLGIK